ncbi:IS630 family transposase [Candidatus Woesebacteria bacterium]|nr:IS630 family transposase [Candidatus Woesebacteria bacterium]
MPEKELLGRQLRKSTLESVRLRAQAVLLRAAGVKIKTIAESLITSVRTITRWLKAFIQRRLASLFSNNIGNENAAKLTREQKKEIKWLLSQPPDEYRIPSRFWDVPKLKQYVSAVFDVVYESDVSYHLLLKFCGLSLKYPDVVSPRRDEEAIKKRVREIRREIKPLLESGEWVVFAADETRLQKEAEIRRAWLVKGKRTVVKTERSKQHQNYLGFLDQNIHICHIFPIKRGNSTETIGVLKKLIKQYPDKKLCIAWDNAKWHKSKQLREQLKRGKSLEKIHLIALAPYAPETNPIEHVWGYAKTKLANRANRTFEQIKQQFIQLTHQQTFLYQI